MSGSRSTMSDDAGDEHGMPFRVTPAHPVPDDRVAPAADATVLLPALPGDAPATRSEPVGRPGSPPPGATASWRRGPAPGAVLLGLACVLVAVRVILAQVASAQLDLSLVGPLSIGVVGAVLLVVGLLGLVVRSR